MSEIDKITKYISQIPKDGLYHIELMEIIKFNFDLSQEILNNFIIRLELKKNGKCIVLHNEIPRPNYISNKLKAFVLDLKGNYKFLISDILELSLSIHMLEDIPEKKHEYPFILDWNLNYHKINEVI